MMIVTSMSSDADDRGFSPDDILVQLDRICSSPIFSRASALKRLLRYLVEKVLEGRTQELSRQRVYKEFGEPKLKLKEEESLSIYKKRIQKRLNLYYTGASPADVIRIS